MTSVTVLAAASSSATSSPTVRFSSGSFASLASKAPPFACTARKAFPRPVSHSLFGDAARSPADLLRTDRAGGLRGGGVGGGGRRLRRRPPGHPRPRLHAERGSRGHLRGDGE